MRLTPDQLNEVIDAAVFEIQTRIIQANATDELDDLFNKLELGYLLGDTLPHYDYYDLKRSKILVLAFSFHSINDLRMRASKLGVDQNRIEFVEFKSNFNYGKLRYTDKYSDIIVGPVPHKGVDIGDASSFLAAVEAHPEEYPKVQRLTDSTGKLKVTTTGFDNCIKNSEYLKNCLN